MENFDIATVIAATEAAKNQNSPSHSLEKSIKYVQNKIFEAAQEGNYYVCLKVLPSQAPQLKEYFEQKKFRVSATKLASGYGYLTICWNVKGE